jgi:Gpi18-like mannosyltransferase
MGHINMKIRLNRYIWGFIIIICLAIAMRINDLRVLGYYGDMIGFNAPWAYYIRYWGLFRIYIMSPTTNYPPIFLFILDFVSSIVPPYSGRNLQYEFVILTKLFSVIAEIAFIGIVYVWLPKATSLKWVIPLLLTIHPGMIMTSANWGQTDSILTLFLVLTIIALNRNQRRMAWIWFALTMLMKFQGIVLLPMVGILSLRRFGLRPTIKGFLLGLFVFSAVYAPFILWSGFDNAMRPFTSAVDLNPVISANAFNLWYLLTPSIWYFLPNDVRYMPTDTSRVLGIITLKQVGFLLLGSYVTLVVVFMWRQYIQRREFVWATALYLAFFMLPTQIHERYLFPATALSLIAIVQDRRMWFIALPLMFSFTCNIVALPADHFMWLGLDLKVMLQGLGLVTASLNLLCLIGLVWIVIRGKDITNTDTINMGNLHPRLETA